MSEEIFDKYLQWIDEGHSFSRIREDLAKNGINPDEIKSILQHLDHIATDRKIRKINSSQGTQWIIAGSILSIFSLILFAIAFLPTMFFASAGLASGMSMILWGKKKMNQGLNFKSPNKKEEFKRRT
jgi:hypothetical protein